MNVFYKERRQISILNVYMTQPHDSYLYKMEEYSICLINSFSYGGMFMKPFHFKTKFNNGTRIRGKCPPPSSLLYVYLCIK